MRKLLDTGRLQATYKSSLFLTLGGVLYSGCQDQHKTWFVPEKKSQVPLFRKKMLGIQITEQHPGSSLSLAAIEADLLWGSDLSKLTCRFAFWI